MGVITYTVITTQYIQIVANEEMARSYVNIVEDEDKEIQKTVDEVTILFNEKEEIVKNVVKEAEEAIINSNNKDKEVFDGQTIEAKEQLAKDAKILTETLSTLK